MADDDSDDKGIKGTDVIYDGEQRATITSHNVKCPFCGGNLNRVENFKRGAGIIHSEKPMCKEFDVMEPHDYLDLVRTKIGPLPWDN